MHRPVCTGTTRSSSGKMACNDGRGYRKKPKKYPGQRASSRRSVPSGCLDGCFRLPPSLGVCSTASKTWLPQLWGFLCPKARSGDPILISRLIGGRRPFFNHAAFLSESCDEYRSLPECHPHLVVEEVPAADEVEIIEGPDPFTRVYRLCHHNAL